MPLPFNEKIPLSLDQKFPGVAFLIGRIPGLIFSSDRKEDLHRQQPLHRKIIEELLPAPFSSKRFPLVLADQQHGSNTAVIVPPFLDTQQVNQVDGLLTGHGNVILGITVADCAPVWIVDKQGRFGGVIHAGKKGTEAGIVSKAIAKMQEEFQIAPKDLIVTIGPCIRPPCYEIDFAEMIRKQAAAAGVPLIQDQKTCTACHLDRYYSYRREQGRTGHMLAILLLQKKR